MRDTKTVPVEPVQPDAATPPTLTKKLRLNRDTLRRLSRDELLPVQGGIGRGGDYYDNSLASSA